MTSNSFTNRLYINSDDGLPLDAVYNKTKHELGTSDVRAKPNQSLTLGVVKAVIPSSIGTYSHDPFVNNKLRFDNIKNANIKGTGTAAQRAAYPLVLGSTLTWHVEGSSTGNMIIFNPSADQNIPTTVVAGGITYTVSTAVFCPKQNIVDMLGIMNAASSVVFYFEPTFLVAGIYRIAYNDTTGSVIFPWCGTDPTVARSLGMNIQSPNDYLDPQDFYLYNNDTGVPAQFNSNPYRVQYFLRDPNLASVLPVINVTTNYSVDSFASNGGGARNVISQIPVSVYNLASQAQNISQTTIDSSGGATPTYQTGGDNMLEGTIVFQNNNLVGGHKSIGVSELSTFIVELQDSKGQPLNLQGQNYIIEFEAKSRGDI